MSCVVQLVEQPPDPALDRPMALLGLLLDLRYLWPISLSRLPPHIASRYRWLLYRSTLSGNRERMLLTTVSVFGGTGFLGRRLVRRLAAAGAAVRVAVRHPDQARRALGAA